MQERQGLRTSENGFTLIELMIAVGLVSLLVGLAVPGLMRARMTANEVGAIGSLRVTAAAQKAYTATCGLGHYAATFTMLGATGPGNAPAFISDDLGQSLAPVKAGYAYNMNDGLDATPGPTDCAGTATVSAFYATAVPTATGWTGSRSFAVNDHSVIWEVAGGMAPAEPFGPPAQPIN